MKNDPLAIALAATMPTPTLASATEEKPRWELGAGITAFGSSA